MFWLFTKTPFRCAPLKKLRVFSWSKDCIATLTPKGMSVAQQS